MECYSNYGTTMAGLEVCAMLHGAQSFQSQQVCTAAPTSDVELSADPGLNNSSTTCLQAKGYSLPFDAWHEAVHGSLPYHRLLAKDEQLAAVLASIPLPKYVFTNADRKHAEVCLQLLGLSHLFEVSPCLHMLWLHPLGSPAVAQWKNGHSALADCACRALSALRAFRKLQLSMA